jgi:hypothetical protein
MGSSYQSMVLTVIFLYQNNMIGFIGTFFKRKYHKELVAIEIIGYEKSADILCNSDRREYSKTEVGKADRNCKAQIYLARKAM